MGLSIILKRARVPSEAHFWADLKGTEVCWQQCLHSCSTLLARLLDEKHGSLLVPTGSLIAS